MTIPWIVALLAATVAALCAVADGALLTIPPDAPVERGAARLLLARREHAHRALVFARRAAQITLGAAFALALGLGARPFVAGLPLALLAAVVLVVIVESLALEVGDALGEVALAALAPVVVVVEFALWAPVRAAAALDGLLQRLLPLPPPDSESREASVEQFSQVVAAEAEVSRDEELLLRRVFSLGETSVADVMIPRVDIVGIEKDTPWSEVVDRVRSSEHARFPVFDGDLDEIVGILYAKDLLGAVIADEEPEGGWAAQVRPAQFIPATKRVDDQLRDFRQSRSHIAIVVDEYGGTAGLVTMEDALEEIVGDIHDEYDLDEPEVEQEEGTRFWIAGRLTLDELSEITGFDFRRDDVATVGGLVYELIGRVPSAGEAIVLDGWKLVVERVRRRRIERVYFERLPIAATTQAAE